MNELNEFILMIITFSSLLSQIARNKQMSHNFFLGDMLLSEHGHCS